MQKKKLHSTSTCTCAAIRCVHGSNPAANLHAHLLVLFETQEHLAG